MRCTYARALLTKRLYEPLTGNEGESLERHLAGCGSCRAVETAEAGFEARLRTAAPPLASSDTVVLDRARVLERGQAPSRPLLVLPPSTRLAGAAAGVLGVAALIGLVVSRLVDRPEVTISAGPLPSAPLSASARVPPPPRPRIGPAGPRRRGPAASEGGRQVSAAVKPAGGGRARVSPATPDDARYLDGYDPGLLAEWMVGDARDPELRALLERELSRIRVQDDFVEIPLPRLAAAKPGDPAVRTAIQNYEKEAGVVDSRLFRRVTLRAKAKPLSELCEELEKEIGVRLRATRGVGDENVTVLVKDQPVRDVMRAVARLFGYKWSRTGEAGAYRYELYQDLRSQLAEEEMRNRDRHAALLALDERMEEYRPLMHLTREQLKARVPLAKDREKELLAMLEGRGWGVVQMYYRLTPAQRATLANGEALTFSTHSPREDLRIPGELRKRILDSTGMTLGVFEGGRAIVDSGFGQAGTPLADIPDASASVALHLQRSELGELTLSGWVLGQLESEPNLKRMFYGGSPEPAKAKSPSVAKPENRTANAALRSDPAFQRKVSLAPKSGCPWFAPHGRPPDVEGFELVMGGSTITFGPDGMERTAVPHVTSAEVWEAVHDATGQPIITDAYSHIYSAAKMKLEDQTTFEALCRLGDEMGVRWRKDGAFVLARSTSFFWDKLKEVPARHLRRWHEHRKEHGLLPLEDVLEMSTLSDAQLDARGVGFVIGHCWGLEEWGMVGSGGSFRLGLPGGKYMRRYARFLAGLAPLQLTQARQPAGLAAAALTGPQQESLLRLVLDGQRDPSVLERLRFQADYSPVGTFLWYPVAETSTLAEELNRKWSAVMGRTPEEALALARQFNPMANPREIKKSRGAFMIRFENARGDAWQEGGPGVAFRSSR